MYIEIGDNSYVPFAIRNVTEEKIDELGGMNALVKENVARNLWTIMKEFKVLPTEQRFQELTGQQIDFIISSMNYDHRLQERARKGLDVNSTLEDNDESWWYASHEDFEPIVEGHDEEDIARQVQEKLSEADRKSLRDRFDSELEYQEYLNNGGEDFYKDSLKEHIQKNLDNLRDEAKEGKFKEEKMTRTDNMSMDEIQNAIDIFDDNEDDMDGYM